MKHTSHPAAPHRPTWIAILRAHVQTWRKANGWSRETVCEEIVQAHGRIDGPAVTGVVFDPDSRDTFTRQRANAERVLRWLDDESKDNNLLTANMVQTVLAALPSDLRLSALDTMLRPLNMAAHCMFVGVDLAAGPDCTIFTSVVGNLIKESGEAHLAVLALVDGIDPGELEAAQKELSEALASYTQALATVEARMGRPI